MFLVNKSFSINNGVEKLYKWVVDIKMKVDFKDGCCATKAAGWGGKSGWIQDEKNSRTRPAPFTLTSRWQADTGTWPGSAGVVTLI